MDIHKPKPWHGIREFLKEYLIIVIGVLTALGAEAVVERVHEARLSDEARAAVRAELNTDVTLIPGRLAYEPCVARRFDEIAALLDRAQEGKPFAPPHRVGSPLFQTLATQRWDAATAGGRIALLSSDEQGGFARVYNPIKHITATEVEEGQAWAHLSALNGARRLSPGMIDAERLALSEARAEDGVIKQLVPQAQFYARRVGVKGDAQLVLTSASAKLTASPAVCRPLGGAAH